MLLELLGVAALIIGVFFCAVGVVGVIRMPDTLTRLHASGKVAILGLFGLLLGSALLVPATALRLLVLGIFLLLTSPVATHAIAASVYRRREIAQQLDGEAGTDDPEEGSDYAVDVTAVLARSRLDEIMEALERTQQRRDHPDSQ